MSEKEFWAIIDLAWADSPELYKTRAEVLQNNDEEMLEKLSYELNKTILKNYKQRLSLLEKEEFTEFLHILEEKLYNIYREEIQEFTDGSDDGFLYCRCFILGMGEEYYKMIDKNPSKATYDLEAETFGFSAYGIYEKKFGEEFERNSIHCIESCSNETGWKT